MRESRACGQRRVATCRVAGRVQSGDLSLLPAIWMTSSPPTSPGRPKSGARPAPSPLRAESPPLTAEGSPAHSPRTSVGHLLPGPPPIGDRQKSRARDLLRKHYGLGVGPPAPLPGRPADPMDLGEPRHAKNVSPPHLATIEQTRPHSMRRRTTSN